MGGTQCNMMRALFVARLCVLVLLACATVSAEDAFSGFDLSKPLELSDSDFDSSIADGRIWTIMFYAPWCGHCKKAMPMWDRLAKSEDIKAAGVQIARIDGSAGGKQSMQKWAVEHAGLSSFPSIIRFQDGKVWSWTGDRKFGPIESWSTQPGVAPIPEPTLISRAYQKGLGYVSHISRWLSGQNTTVVACAIMLIIVGMIWFGFL